MSDALRYPIGLFVSQPYTEALRREWLTDIAQLPLRLEAAIQDLDAWQLDTPYRPGGWTVAQVVHHLADSHLNCFCRLKLALTELNPVIRPYDESQWVMQPDAALPVNNATTLLHVLHKRLYAIWSALGEAEWQRTYVHPDTGTHTVWDLLGMYAWHGRHHLAHITALREREAW